jgi:hypothetical protein
MIRHLAAPAGIGACAKPDGILDAISRRNARSDYCCLRAARVFSFERAGQAADNYSIELRPDVESLVLPGRRGNRHRGALPAIDAWLRERK